jgi:hypothetical protein
MGTKGGKVIGMSTKKGTGTMPDKGTKQQDKTVKGPDGFRIEPGTYYNTHLLLNPYLASSQQNPDRSTNIAEHTRIWKNLVEGNATPWGYVLIACLQRIDWNSRNKKGQKFLDALGRMAETMVRKKLVMTSPVLKDLFELVGPEDEEDDPFIYSVEEIDIAGFAERAAAQRPLSAECCKAVRSYRDRLSKLASNSRRRGIVARLTTAIGEAPLTLIEPNEAWSDLALDQLERMKANQRRAWEALLRQSGIHNPHKPYDAWLQEAKPCLEAVG